MVPRASVWTACDLSPLSDNIADDAPASMDNEPQPKAVLKPPHSRRFAVAYGYVIAAALTTFRLAARSTHF